MQPSVFLRASELRRRHGISGKRGNKYGAKRTEYGGRTYDSKGEAGLAATIDLLCRAGVITKCEPQRTFVLYGKGGHKICSHRVDFLLTFSDGHQEVQEFKGWATKDWDIKRKLFEDNYPDIKYVVVR